LKPKVGDTWIADETYIRIDKQKPTDPTIENPYSRSRKAKWVVFWDIIDADTRFLLASVAATSRSAGEARELMLKAAKRAGNKNVKFTSKLLFVSLPCAARTTVNPVEHTKTNIVVTAVLNIVGS